MGIDYGELPAIKQVFDGCNDKNDIGVIGKVVFSVRHLSSATTTYPTSWQFSNNQPCIGNTARQALLHASVARGEKLVIDLISASDLGRGAKKEMNLLWSSLLELFGLPDDANNTQDYEDEHKTQQAV